MINQAFVALGSNMDDPATQLKRALQLLGKINSTQVVQTSSFYKTEPLVTTAQTKNQDWYINAVCEIKTGLTLDSFYAAMLDVEKQMGRIRTQRWAPRLIDLDLLFFGNKTADTDHLSLPHPQLQNRLFVLKPLEEIASNFVHPVLQKTIGTLLNECTDTLQIKKLT